MDVPGIVLLAWFLGSLLLLTIVEAQAVVNNTPTISERVRSLGRATIVIVMASFLAGYLLCHFFDNFVPH